MQEPQSETKNITVVELQALCTKITEQKKLVEKAKDDLSELEAVYDSLEEKFIATMEELKLKSFKDSNMLFGLKETMQLAAPKGEQKEIFFNYLKEIGHFDALATVHARTLASWYNQEHEAAITRGEPGFFAPGLELPTKRIGLYIRKS